MTVTANDLVAAAHRDIHQVSAVELSGLARGQYDVRVAGEGGVEEVRVLRDAFNSMATAIERDIHEREDIESALKEASAPLRIAGEWTLGVPEPWSVAANGVCEGGEVTIGNDVGSRTIVVAAPFCEPAVRP